MRGRARSMRHEPTEAEQRLWTLLRSRRFLGFKFRRQFPVGNYIADFICLEARLIIEADGSQHAESPRDLTRDTYLRAQNFHLLRLWNNDILASPDAVAETIWATLHRGQQTHADTPCHHPRLSSWPPHQRSLPHA
ncbi:endonuclease domain-containing protein [Devosia sp. Leaf420]|uniref:endonuclease domain-containing protein n=1 Tax=Devosia sp. Leaf420 TaxID=1736374 RepID=UPI0009EC11D8|nr:endonuclease domain-containing protein [Devosia sp. Leaf420]